MSFGRPGGALDSFRVAPPDRGSFPLDHDGDCKSAMMGYLKCLKLNGGNNGECRIESKAYLQCRMDHDLMTKDDMANLGLGDVGQDHTSLRPDPSLGPNSNTSSRPSTLATGAASNTPTNANSTNTTDTTPRI